MKALYHHSRLTAYRSPQGAVPCGTAVTISAMADASLKGAKVFLRLWCEGVGETRIEMAGDGLLQASFAVPNEPTMLWYWFLIEQADGQTRYLGASSGEGELYDHEPPAWRITVYDGAFETPKWFQEGIAYQIFPDRFRRSSWEDFYARAESYKRMGRSVRVHDQWLEEPAYLPAAGEEDYAPDDYFGGDLNGITQKLPYLTELGVTCLYLNPIFEAASNHRYNTADYQNIDPILGTNEDFARLCAAAKQYGIRLMLDGVFSHTGSDSRYFDREHRYDTMGAFESKDSPYYDWYDFKDWPNEYDCWWDFVTLPNVKELTPSYVDFIAGENGVLAHWARLGATSWRLDVADELPDDFIRILRKRLKQIDPEGVLLGEVWEECSAKMGKDGRRGYVGGDELDSAMDYPFANAVFDFLLERDDAETFAGRLMALAEWYPEPFFKAQLNLLSSHDVIRAATVLAGAPHRDALTREQQAVYEPSAENAAKGKARFLLASAIQMFAVGVPCVYYGDEVYMTGMADPFNRRPYPWGREDRETLERMKTLLHLRRDRDALKNGRCRMGAIGSDVFGIIRYTRTDMAMLFINRSDEPQTVELTATIFPEGPDGPDALCFDGAFTDEHGNTACATTFTVPPHAALIRIRKEDF